MMKSDTSIKIPILISDNLTFPSNLKLWTIDVRLLHHHSLEHDVLLDFNFPSTLAKKGEEELYYNLTKIRFAE